MTNQILAWIVFNIFIVTVIALDLGVFHRHAKDVKVKDALIWCGVWIALAFVFNIGIYFVRGREVALNFLAGYLLEESLSVDNIFVFILIFSQLHVPSIYQHKVLGWGICGALIMRALFIITGVALLQYFHWVIYILGAFLVFTGFKMVFNVEKDIDPTKNPFLLFIRKHFAVTEEYHENKFFIKKDNRTFLTPLFVVVLLIAITDLIFAMDSIPAILAITDDPFIVYSSNAFAVLGLRSLFFAVAGLMKMFHYLHFGLAAILIFLGSKMLLDHFFEVPVVFTLLFIITTLGISIFASLRLSKT